MALVNGHNLAYAYGANDIFTNITVSIPHGARIALVGPNGSGKTTLLRLLAARETPDEGKLTLARGLDIGYLPQEATHTLTGSGPLWDEMLEAFTEVIAMEGRLEDMAHELAERPDDEDLLAQYGEAQTRFEAAGGYDYGLRIKQVLRGLGFDEDDFERPVEQLSGGQRTRALLARLLLGNPDLLILDEPTNHLDIRAIEWLEGWLRDYDGALLVVSHDRYFMDRVVNTIWELNFGRLETFRGNYSHYLQQREERWELADKLYERERDRLLKEIDYIKRNMGSRGTTQAQGRLKRLSRQLMAIQEVGLVNAVNSTSWLQLDIGNVRTFSVEEAERRIQSLPRPQKPKRALGLEMRAAKRSGDKVLVTEGLVVGYHDDGIPLFEVPDITLYRGETAALIGPNGAGKSTLLKTLLERLEPLDGIAKIGASVEIGYFAQAHEGLDPQRTIIDEIYSVQHMAISEARNYLGRFLFSGDDVFKPVAALSGGERGRVALAKLALGGSNFLLLDEPTNHLDIPSQEVLEAVLADFNGTVLIVSHDRYLIRALATQIWAVDVPADNNERQMVVYEGPYEEYLAWRDGVPQPSKPEPTPSPVEPASSPRNDKPAMSKYERNRRLAQVEDTIHRLEAQMVNLSGELAAASESGDVAAVSRLGAAYADTETELDALMTEWEALLVEQ